MIKGSSIINLISNKIKPLLGGIFLGLTVVLLLLTCFLMGNKEFSFIAQRDIFKILYIDIVLLILVAYFFAKRIYKLWINKKSNGSQVQIKLIYIFALLAILPSVLMMVFSGIFFHKGIDAWFNKHNESVLIEASNVAEAYMKETISIAKDDALGVTRFIELALMAEPVTKIENKQYLKEVIENAMEEIFIIKNIHSGMVTNSQKEILAVSENGVSLCFVPVFGATFFDCINSGGILQLASADSSDILLVTSIKIPFQEDTFLIIRKKIDEKIINQIKKTKLAYDEYNELKLDRFHLESMFTIIFLIITFLLALGAINFAIIFSEQLLSPIFGLIDSAIKIKNGDLNIRAVASGNSAKDLRLLTKTFNLMIDQLQQQQKDLEMANMRLDEKVRFISGVLAGVPSGVIGVDDIFNVTLFNEAAKNKIGANLKNGVDLFQVLPQLDKKQLEKKQSFSLYNQSETQIDYYLNHQHFIFIIKVVPISMQGNISYIITVDDITDLTNAQRQAAWADVARRVAHEIKNPLTPIQLAAERIHRKYLKQIIEGQDIFNNLINSIIKQVSDIKRLTDEFSCFARLPEPILKIRNLLDVLKQAVFFMQNAYHDVQFIIEPLDQVGNFDLLIDERLIHQVFVNIMKNAVNAIQNDKNTIAGMIRIKIVELENEVCVAFADNGPGLPHENRDRLTDPYFTLTPKGTGLGLTIVKKIMQDHNGYISFDDNPEGGALVILHFLNKEKNYRKNEGE